METLVAWLNRQRGRRTELAEALHIYPSALSQWNQVPADRVLDVERFTGISRHLLRPDLYGPVPEDADRLGALRCANPG